MPFMQNRTHLAVMMAAAFLMVSAETGSARAQWIQHPDPATPRTADGKPNLTAPAPKKDDKPDLSGIWKIVRPRTIPAEAGSYASLDYWMTGGEMISMQPWAESMNALI